MLHDFLTQQLRDLEALADDLDDDLEDVRAARLLVRRFRVDPRLRDAPLTVRRALFDARNVSARLRRLHTQGDPQ